VSSGVAKQKISSKNKKKNLEKQINKNFNNIDIPMKINRKYQCRAFI
jgi:hypothetical protein